MSMPLTLSPTTLPRTFPSLGMPATATAATLSTTQPTKSPTVFAWPTHSVSLVLPNELLTEICFCVVQQAIASPKYCLFDAREPDVCTRLRLTSKLWNGVVQGAVQSGRLYTAASSTPGNQLNGGTAAIYLLGAVS